MLNVRTKKSNGAASNGGRRHRRSRDVANGPRRMTPERAALRYARQGLSVVPLHGIVAGACTCSLGADCANAGKHPRTRNGVKDASSDADVIRGWFQRWPDANVAIATGALSGVVVLDIDPRNGGHDSLRQTERVHGPLPASWLVQTGGGGQHLYFAAPTMGITTTHGSLLGFGIDVQGDGAYVVAPPSRHVSGLVYVWHDERGLYIPLAELPPAYRRLLRGKKAKPDRKVKSETPPEVVSKSAAIAEGQRNTQLTSMAGRLVAADITGRSLLAALQAENATFQPPLTQAEVKKVADSVGRYDPNPRGDEAENIARALLDDRFTSEGERRLLHASDGQFWHFEKSHWRPVPENWLKGKILDFAGAWPGRKKTSTSALLSQVEAILEALTAAKDDVLRFNEEPLPVINCANGELWIRPDGEMKLKPHSAGSYLRQTLPVNFDPAATCPRFDRAIGEIFANSADPKAMVDFWHELVGYAIQTRRNLPLVVICKGGGSNGKTALIETLVRLIGRDLVAAMAVEDLDKSRFTVGSLLGKQLFLDDDVKTGTKLPDGNLKRLSEEKTMTGERKYGAPFTFTVRTLPILLCNNPPTLSDLSHGMQRRLIIVPFDRTFSGKEVQKDLFPAIHRTEMSGVLNRALAGLGRVIERGWKIEPPDTVESAKKRWLIEANPLPAFIDACCHPTGKCYAEELYQAYLDWARSSGVTMHQQRTSFDRNLESSGFKFGTKGNRGKRVVGLSLKN